jgi:hypothetical protein
MPVVFLRVSAKELPDEIAAIVSGGDFIQNVEQKNPGYLVTYGPDPFVPTVPSFLLLEDGDDLLLETGDKFLLQN